MSKVLVNNSSLADIAAAIREKNESDTKYKPAEMGAAIRDIESGGGDFVGIKYSDFDSYRGNPRVADARSLSTDRDDKLCGGYPYLFAAGSKQHNGGFTSMVEEFYLPDGIKALYSNMFWNCCSIKKIYGDLSKVTAINSSCFMYSNIERFDYYLPKLETINANAFNSCLMFIALALRNETLVTLANANALTNTHIYKGTGYIYVPKALIEEYKAATNWVTYANQFRALEDYTVDGTITGALDESKIAA